jgi:hypothetical protein
VHTHFCVLSYQLGGSYICRLSSHSWFHSTSTCKWYTPPTVQNYIRLWVVPLLPKHSWYFASSFGPLRPIHTSLTSSPVLFRTDVFSFIRWQCRLLWHLLRLLDSNVCLRWVNLMVEYHSRFSDLHLLHQSIVWNAVISTAAGVSDHHHKNSSGSDRTSHCHLHFCRLYRPWYRTSSSDNRAIATPFCVILQCTSCHTLSWSTRYTYSHWLIGGIVLLPSMPWVHRQFIYWQLLLTRHFDEIPPVLKSWWINIRLSCCPQAS